MLIHKLPGEPDSAGIVCQGGGMCLVCDLGRYLDVLCRLGGEGHRYIRLANQLHEDGHDQDTD